MSIETLMEELMGFEVDTTDPHYSAIDRLVGFMQLLRTATIDFDGDRATTADVD